VRFDRSGHLAYSCAIAAAALGSLITLFRTVAAALLLCWAWLEWSSRDGRASAPERARRFVAYASLIAIVVVAGYVAINSSVISRRLANPASAYGRLATWQSAATIAVTNPVAGVGLMNYRDYFRQKYVIGDEGMAAVNDVRAAETPHSNPLWIAAEMGLPALALYVLASFYILLAAMRGLAREGAGKIAAACALGVLAAYWITGLTLASGAYSDLNLYFFFMSGLLLNVAATGAPRAEKGR
jgi:O-antigen ligase